MTKRQILDTVENILLIEGDIAELKTEAEKLRSNLKAEMEKKDVEELQAGAHVVRNTSVISTRFDTKRFKEDLGEEVYNKYTKQVASRRFSIA